MKTIWSFVGLSFALLVLTSCETTSSRPYIASTTNVIKLQELMSSVGGKVALGEFTQGPDIAAPGCRMLGPVDVAPGQSIAVYIKEAMLSEMFLVEVYARESDVQIKAHLSALSMQSFTPASWNFEITVSSPRAGGFTLATSYPFKTSFSAYGACQNAATAFAPAVQDLIDKIITHPSFIDLVGA